MCAHTLPVLRSLGLPARSVTNFNSAHDTNFNRAIDKYYDENGDYISTGDSIWYANACNASLIQNFSVFHIHVVILKSWEGLGMRL